MKKLLLFLQKVVIVSFLITITETVSAASLYIDPAINSLNRGDAVTLSVRLDVDKESGECVNAVDGVMTYSDNIEPVDVTVGDSIFSLWVEKPIINRTERTITFAGGTPNGYCGRVIGDPRLTNTIAKLVFRSPGFTIAGDSDNDTAEVRFTDASVVYLNDGFGTKVIPIKYSASFKLNKKPGNILSNPWKEEVRADNIKPESFSVSLQKDDQAFSQKYYIIFNTTDKQTGVDHYEVMEESLAQFATFQWGRADAPWIEVSSPYVLRDQSLNSIIRVKAVDKSGNFYLANIIPDESMRTISRDELYSYIAGTAALLLIVVVVLGSIWFIRKRKIKKNKTSDVKLEDSDDNVEYEYDN